MIYGWVSHGPRTTWLHFWWWSGSWDDLRDASQPRPMRRKRLCSDCHSLWNHGGQLLYWKLKLWALVEVCYLVPIIIILIVVIIIILWIHVIVEKYYIKMIKKANDGMQGNERPLEKTNKRANARMGKKSNGRLNKKWDEILYLKCNNCIILRFNLRKVRLIVRIPCHDAKHLCSRDA